MTPETYQGMYVLLLLSEKLSQFCGFSETEYDGRSCAHICPKTLSYVIDFGERLRRSIVVKICQKNVNPAEKSNRFGRT